MKLPTLNAAYFRKPTTIFLIISTLLILYYLLPIIGRAFWLALVLLSYLLI